MRSIVRFILLAFSLLWFTAYQCWAAFLFLGSRWSLCLKVLLVPVEAFIARTGYSLTWGTRLDRIAAELVKLAKSRSAASWFTSLNE